MLDKKEIDSLLERLKLRVKLEDGVVWVYLLSREDIASSIDNSKTPLVLSCYENMIVHFEREVDINKIFNEYKNTDEIEELEFDIHNALERVAYINNVTVSKYLEMLFRKYFVSEELPMVSLKLVNKGEI